MARHTDCGHELPHTANQKANRTMMNSSTTATRMMSGRYLRNSACRGSVDS